MNILYLILALVFGLVIGSFLNVLIFRLDSLNTIWSTRSHCPKCKKKLLWYDLVPVFSYIILGGRCRFCQEKISLQYPIVELSTGLLFVFLLFSFGLSIALFYYMIIFSLLVVILVSDLKTQMMPEIFAWIGLILALLFGWYFGNLTIPSALWGGVIGGGFLALLVYGSLIVSGASEKWMGAGDIKIGAIMGFLVGFPAIILGLFFAFISGAIVGLIYIKLQKKTIKESLPFAPFLILSTLLTLVYGQYLLNWYWNLYIF
jgi:leader peptidase (prepilin peptidase) / N-methyltransferase